MNPRILMSGVFALTLIAAGPALAAGISVETDTSASADSQAEIAVDEMTKPENQVPGPDGTSHAEGGPAEPVENWFGCPPDDKENCEAQPTPATQSEAKAQGDAEIDSGAEIKVTQ